MIGLNSFQFTVARALTALSVVHVPVLILLAWLLRANVVAIGLAASALAAVPVIALLRHRPTKVIGFALAVTLVAQTSLLVFAFKGHPWQVETHFYYFAILAMLAGFCDWSVLVVAAVLISVHHLGLNELLPAALFPGGSNIFRTLVHAMCVVIETAMLIFIGSTIRRAFAEAQAARKEEADAMVELKRLGVLREQELAATI